MRTASVCKKIHFAAGQSGFKHVAQPLADDANCPKPPLGDSAGVKLSTVFVLTDFAGLAEQFRLLPDPFLTFYLQK